MIKLARPYFPEGFEANLLKVLNSGNIVQGEYVRRLESKVEQYLPVRNAILVSSGTAALHLALLALDIKKGEEIIVPAFTFPATANVVEIVGAKIVPVDITLNDYCIDISKIEEKITNKTKAIIPVHEFGNIADMDKLLAISKHYGIEIIEDAACALGTEYNHKKAGIWGKIGCFSLHPRKNITTGEGGIVVTNDDEIAEKINSLRSHGMVIKNGKYDFLRAGLNYRMTDFQAALGLSQFSELENIITHRISMAKIYNNLLKDNILLRTPFDSKYKKHTYQTYHVLLDKKIDRDKLIADLRDAQIESNLGAYALNVLTYYKNKYRYNKNDFPNAITAYKHGLALPMGMHLCRKDIELISKSLKIILIENGF